MKSDIFVLNQNQLPYSILAYDKIIPCQIGSNGMISSEAKQEGDFSTPKGDWLLNSVFYRKDRLNLENLVPECHLEKNIITRDCGWCDDPSSKNYNQHMKIEKNINVSYEKLWREDHAYDIFIDLDYNQNPTLKFKGSAVFIHCSFDNLRKTAGCIALSKEDLIFLLRKINKTTYIRI